MSLNDLRTYGVQKAGDCASTCCACQLNGNTVMQITVCRLFIVCSCVKFEVFHSCEDSCCGFVGYATM